MLGWDSLMNYVCWIGLGLAVTFWLEKKKQTDE